MVIENNFGAMYNRVARHVTKDLDHWLDYLSLSSQLYKYSFVEKLMVYDQDPQATFLADADTWRLLGRTIQHEKSSILVFKDEPTGFKKHHLFDVRQTEGKRLSFPDWSEDDRITSAIIRKFYATTFSVPEFQLEKEMALDHMLSDIVFIGVSHFFEKDSTELVKKHSTLIEQSVLYSVGEKAPWLKQVVDYGILEQITTVTPGIELNTIGVVTNEVTRSMLKHIYSIKKEMQSMKQKEDQLDEQQERESGNDVFKQSNERPALAGLRNNSEELPKGEFSNEVHDITDRGRINDVSSQDRSGSSRLRDYTRETIAEEKSLSRHRGPVEESHALENYSESSERNGGRGNDTTTDLKIDQTLDTNSLKKNSHDRKEVGRDSSASFSDFEKRAVYETVLKNGSLSESGKYKIFDRYQQGGSREDQVLFLQQEFGSDGYKIPEGPEIQFDSRGIHIRFNDDEVDHYSWEIVESDISALLTRGKYLKEDEREEYLTYLRERPFTKADFREVLLAGPLVVNGKKLIQEYFSSEKNRKKRLEEVKVLHGSGSSFYSESTRSKVTFLEDGMEISTVGKTSSLLFSWESVTEEIEQLIREGDYLGNEPIEQNLLDFDGVDNAGHSSRTSLNGDYKNIEPEKVEIKYSELEKNEYFISVLKKGSLFVDGKFRVFDIIKDNDSKKECIAKLKNEFGQAGRHPVDEPGIDYGTKGITIWFSDEHRLFLWSEIERTLRMMVATNMYFDESGWTEYRKYLERNELKESEQNQTNTSTVKNQDRKEVEDTETLSLFDFDYTEDTAIERTDKKIDTPVATNLTENKSMNYFFDGEKLYADSKRDKFKDNIEAIKLMKKMEQTTTEATYEEQEILAKYSGWGGLSEAFDERNTAWVEEYKQLKGLLTEEEYRTARASVLTAFFTSPELIRSMYRALNRMNDFKHATILDPAMGTGNFFMTLPDHLKAAEQIGVELDPLTANIAKLLYPESSINHMGFEKLDMKEKVDVVIGNIPFNDIKVLDKKYDKYNFVIHDYFMAKSIDSLKENGVMMLITSAASMDKKNSKAREYLAKRAHFVGGIRLPKTAFKQSAGTEVISDILIFQKKSLAEMTQEYVAPSWVESKAHPDYPEIHMNKYFIENPEQILGSIAIKNFHGQTLDILPNKEIPLISAIDAAFTKAIDGKEFRKTKKINKVVAVKKKEEVIKENEPVEVPADCRKYSFFEKNNRVFFHKTGDDFEELKSQTIKQKVKAMIDVRNSLMEVIEIQQSTYERATFEQALERLNQTYDRFVDKFDYFNDVKNIRDLRMDDQYPLLRSIEKEQDNTYVKQPVFFKPTVSPPEQIQFVESAAAALGISLTKRRAVDLTFMSHLYQDKPIEEILKELGNLVYLNPQKLESKGYEHAWEYADEYLTGNVREKLDIAILMELRTQDKELKSQFKRNVEALRAAQPTPLEAGDIQFQIGSPWIPVNYYNQFMYELLDTPEKLQSGKYSTKIDYLDINTSWRVLRKKNDYGVKVDQTYGTSRINAYEIIEASLNLQQVTVKDSVYEDGKTKYVLNPKETMIARGKQQDIEDMFQKWLFSDSDRSIHLLKLYNDRFNTVVPRKYSGKALSFDGMNLQMALRPHQKDVVARILYSGKALMAHEVGAGKTAAMLTAGMYLKQNGLINKPLYVVPNHLTEQWGREILTFYPTANILITTKKDFEKENRQAFVSKIATGDYDAIIIGHSQFERIPLSKERQAETINLQIHEIIETVKQMKEANMESWSIKAMEKMRVNLENNLEKLWNEEKKDDLLTFEQLGVDFLFVDEAHIYKNLFIYTKMQNVAGVGTSRSQRASDMLSKVRYIQDKHEGKNVVFATGTPISNSMSEMFVMQYFLQPEELKRRGLTSFDSWAATFGQVTSSLEITPEGGGYRIRNRFSKFHNLPELMNMFNLVADIQTADMLKLPVPTLETGKVQTIITKRTEFQENMMQEFVTRSDAIRRGDVKPNIDNMLKLTHEAKLMAIDSRLIDPKQEREEESKLSICATKVFNIWGKSKETRSTQMIFSDSGTPNPTKFNVYDELKTQLVEKGIPPEEIVFIHDAKTDAQRDKMFEKMKKGDVRVLLGSTQKVGTGTNVQHKLIAAHHIDCPWKPSDLIQREGRILRQGNENETVSIYRYVTKGTFDSYLWQIQEQKLTYISQVMSGKSISRSCDDLDETVLSAAEVKAVATDNPLLAEKMSTDNEVTRLQLLRSQWASTRSRMDKNIRETYPNKLAFLKEKYDKVQKDFETVRNNPLEEFSMTIKGVRYNERKDAFEEMMALSMLEPFDSKGYARVEIGEFRGLNVRIDKSEFNEDHLILYGEKSYRTTFNPEAETGNITKLMNLPGHIEETMNSCVEEQGNINKQIDTAREELEKPFIRQDDLDELLIKQRKINKEIELDTLQKNNPTTRKEVEIEVNV